MSIEISCGAAVRADKESSAHWIPVHIEAPNGVHQAQTDNYFSSQIQQSPDGGLFFVRLIAQKPKYKITPNCFENICFFSGLTSSFRGRLLNGETIKFPNNYKCFVVDETRKPLSEDSKRNLFTSSKFTELTYWNWDQRTSENDSIRKMFDWIDIAEEVCV